MMLNRAYIRYVNQIDRQARARQRRRILCWYLLAQALLVIAIALGEFVAGMNCGRALATIGIFISGIVSGWNLLTRH